MARGSVCHSRGTPNARLLLLIALWVGFACSNYETDWTEPRRDDPSVVLQRTRDDCGVAAVATLFGLLGKDVDYDELAKWLDIGSRGLTMRQLSLMASDHGVAAHGYRFSNVQVAMSAAEGKPWIALLGVGTGGHYVVVRSVVGDTADVLDPSMGRRFVKRRAFEEIWTGYALLPN